MSIQIGDKVRFLNSVGGGVVRGFRGKGAKRPEAFTPARYGN